LLAAAGRLGVKVSLLAFGQLPRAREDLLVISTVPAGAAGTYAKQVAESALIPAAVLDVAYQPWPTPLAAAARSAGATLVSGFDLLLYQAARQVELMTGRDAPVGAMRDAGLAALAARAEGLAAGDAGSPAHPDAHPAPAAEPGARGAGLSGPGAAAAGERNTTPGGNALLLRGEKSGTCRAGRASGGPQRPPPT
jgi:hypothetical protein